MLNVNILGIQEKETTSKNGKLEKKGRNSSSHTKRNLSNRGDKEDGEVVQGSTDKQSHINTTAKKKLLKGPKVNATVTHEDFSVTDN